MAVTEAEETKVPSPRPVGGWTLETDKGITTISDDVVAKIAGHACREHPGVSNLGTQFRRLLGRVKPGQGSPARGVNVEVGKKEAAIDLVVVVQHGFAIPSLAQEIRENVIAQVESATGLMVVEVNLEIDDIVFEEPIERRVA